MRLPCGRLVSTTPERSHHRLLHTLSPDYLEKLEADIDTMAQYGGYNAQNGGGYGQSNPYAQQNYGEGGRGYTGAGNGPAYGAGPFSDRM